MDKITPYSISLSHNAITQIIQDNVKTLYDLTLEIQNERVKSDDNINDLLKLRQELASEEKASSTQIQKLQSLIKTSITDTEREEDLLRRALNKITEIRAYRNTCRIQTISAETKIINRGPRYLQKIAHDIPLYVSSKPGEKPPPLCGAIPADSNYIAKVGDMVAALVKVSENEENYISAEVVSYNSNTNKYEVHDIDEEGEDIHVLSKRRIFPLPLMRANPETDAHALFQKGAQVLALYPQSTCFYLAIVSQLPTNHLDDYEVLFEDSTYPEGYSPPINVAQRYVIATKIKAK